MDRVHYSRDAGHTIFHLERTFAGDSLFDPPPLRPALHDWGMCPQSHWRYSCLSLGTGPGIAVQKGTNGVTVRPPTQRLSARKNLGYDLSAPDFPV